MRCLSGQLEAARVAIIEEREARRAKEVERAAAAEEAEQYARQLDVAVKTLERERSQVSGRGLRGPQGARNERHASTNRPPYDRQMSPK